MPVGGAEPKPAEFIQYVILTVTQCNRLRSLDYRDPALLHGQSLYADLYRGYLFCVVCNMGFEAQ